MKKISFLLATIWCASSPLFAQAPAIQWQHAFGGSNTDVLYGLNRTSDGGYILGGFSNSNISGNKTENSPGGYDYWILKLDSIGNLQWQKTIGGNQDDQISAVQQTADGGYILAGYSKSGISGNKTENSWGGFEYWVVKLDATGNIQWQNTIGGNSDDYLWDVQQTPDGGYLLSGNSYSNISGDKIENSQGGSDYWVVKLDAIGNIKWQNTIGGSSNDIIYGSFGQTTDGGYIIGGLSYSDISGDKTENSFGSTDYWIVKLDSTGLVSWQKTIGGSSGEELLAIQETTDGGYILGGDSYSNFSGNKTEDSWGSSDYWIVKLDAIGNIQWQNTIGGSAAEVLNSLEQTADGGYVIGGYSYSDISGDKTENGLGTGDYWVVKLDTVGQIKWQTTIGGIDGESIYGVRQSADGGYILGGTSNSGISFDKTENSWGLADYWLVKLFPEQVSATTTPANQKGVIMYPNPVSTDLFVRADAPTEVSLYSLIGQKVFSQTIRKEDKIDLSTLPNGLYFLMETGSGITHKIVKTK